MNMPELYTKNALL